MVCFIAFTDVMNNSFYVGHHGLPLDGMERWNINQIIIIIIKCSNLVEIPIFREG